MGFKDLTSLLDHNNPRRNTLCMRVNVEFLHTNWLAHREKGDEPRSAFGFDEVRLFLQLLLTFELRTGSSTRNDVGIAEKPTSTLQIRYQ